MGHPQEDMFDAAGAERDRVWQRRDHLSAQLKTLSLAVFTFEQFADLQLVADRSAPSEQAYALSQAIDRLEKFLAALRSSSPSG